MGLKSNKVNSVTIPATCWRKSPRQIISLLRTFLVQALPEGEWTGTLELSRARARVDLPMKTGRYLARTRIATGSKIRFLCCFSRAWRDLRESGHRPLRNSPPLPLTPPQKGLSESVQGDTLVHKGPLGV